MSLLFTNFISNVGRDIGLAHLETTNMAHQKIKANKNEQYSTLQKNQGERGRGREREAKFIWPHNWSLKLSKVKRYPQPIIIRDAIVVVVHGKWCRLEVLHLFICDIRLSAYCVNKLSFAYNFDDKIMLLEKNCTTDWGIWHLEHIMIVIGSWIKARWCMLSQVRSLHVINNHFDEVFESIHSIESPFPNPKKRWKTPFSKCFLCNYYKPEP